MNFVTQRPQAPQQKPVAPVSVVIPTYNAGEYLQETFASIEQQTHLPIEVVVVDDQSTDDTVNTVKQLAAASSIPVTLLTTGVNSGSPGRPMNLGVEAAKGDLIAVLDQDDLWLPGKIAGQSQALLSDEKISLVCSLFDYLRPGGNDGRHPEATLTRLRPSLDKPGDYFRCTGRAAFDLFVTWENFIGGFPGFMFRRADWVAKPKFDESLKVASDFDFLFWLTSRGDMALLPEIHYLRREHDNNVTYHETPRLLDVIRILLRHIAAHEFQQRPDYRRALGWKILRLAQFLAYSGHPYQSVQVLRRYYQVRKFPSDWLHMPAGYAHLALAKPLRKLLQFTQLRKADRQQARDVVATLGQLLDESGVLSQP